MADDLTLHKKGTPAIIANRIVGYGEKPADQFQAHPLNWRKHPQRQRAAVEASLRELGWIGVVIENVQTGNLIDGHERVWQALKAGGDVPYIQVDLSPEEEALALATFDAITNMAETDAAKLDELLRDVSTGEAALMELMAETAKEAGLFLEQPGEADAEPQIDRAEELRQQWGVETGQLWRLPSRTPGQEHRLICGDCTDAAVVQRVIDIPLFIMVTDPPYGISYDASWRDDLFNDANRAIGAVENDDIVDWSSSWRLSPASVAYVYHAPYRARDVEISLIEAGYKTRYAIVWSKPHYVVSRGHYAIRHEAVWMSVKHGANSVKWIGPDNEQTVWEIKLDERAAGGHSTQKPVECMARPIRNHEGDVYEPFCGSGTTIIAAENLARQCRAVEISPGYVAVALQRYQDAFGITAELVE